MRTCLLIAVISITFCSSRVQSQVEHPPTMSATSRPTCNSTRDGHLISIVDASSPLDCDAVGGGNITATCKCEQNPLSTFTWVGVSTGSHTIDTDTDDQVASEVGITDSGSFYSGTNVESALQEVGPKLTDARSPTSHASTHQNGGADEISVDGLLGLLAESQTPLSHAHSGADITSGSVPDTQISSSSVTQHESSLESVLDLQDLQGAVIDSQVPDNVTISSTALRCARYGADGNLTAASGDCASGDTTGTTSPGGLDQQVQINDSGAFGGDAGLVYNKTTDALTAGQINADNLRLDGNTLSSTNANGSAIVAPNGTASLVVLGGMRTADYGNDGNMAYGFTSSATTGIWFQSGTALWLRYLGTDRLGIDGVGAVYQAGSLGGASIHTVADANTGPYHPAADIYALQAGGVEAVRTTASAVTVQVPLVAKFSTISVADDGAGTKPSATLTPGTSYVECSCLDTNPGGCTVTLSETSAVQGQYLTIITTSVQPCEFADTASVSELAGAFVAGIDDALTLIYGSATWREVSRSNN